MVELRAKDNFIEMGIQLSEHFVSKGKYTSMQDGPPMINSGAVLLPIQKEIQSHKSLSNYDTCLLNQSRKKSQRRRSTVRGSAVREKGSKIRGKIGVEALGQKHDIATERMILIQSKHQVITPLPFLPFWLLCLFYYVLYAISVLILMHFKLAYYNKKSS